MPATQDRSPEALSQSVILVDEEDREVGTAPKLRAHQQGLLHRAFSIFVFRQSGELLLQQRAAVKYHTPGLWTNTCCSHPNPGESIPEAAQRRLREEFNLQLPLKEVGQFHYTASLENGLTENEFDHVLVGRYSNEDLTPNPEEIQAYRWISVGELREEMGKQPGDFTPWLTEALDIAEKSL